MKLDRNINQDGRGKYALLKLRWQEKPISVGAQEAARLLKSEGLLDFGDTQDTDFFVIRLKDIYAATALRAYAQAVIDSNGDMEYANEIFNLAAKAESHPNKRIPD